MRVNHRNISGHISQAEKNASERPWGQGYESKMAREGSSGGREERGKIREEWGLTLQNPHTFDLINM